MDILNTKSLECNKQIKINFNGGDLSSDAGALLIKEFFCKVGFDKLFRKIFKTNIELNGDITFEEFIKNGFIKMMKIFHRLFFRFSVVILKMIVRTNLPMILF